jgi:hypothetical protein
LLDAGLMTGILLVSYLVDIAGAMRAARARDVAAGRLHRPRTDRSRAWPGRTSDRLTVNDADRACALVDIGVDAICSDTPRELLAALTQSPP